jgi:hypothetical protein
VAPSAASVATVAAALSHGDVRPGDDETFGGGVEHAGQKPDQHLRDCQAEDNPEGGADGENERAFAERE